MRGLAYATIGPTFDLYGRSVPAFVHKTAEEDRNEGHFALLKDGEVSQGIERHVSERRDGVDEERDLGTCHLEYELLSK